MMTNVTSLGPDGIEWISSNLGSLVMDRKLSSGSTRMENLVRLVSNPQLSYSNSNDLDELEEDDVWGDGFQASENGKDDPFALGVREKLESTDIPKTFNSRRRFLAVDRDSSLSLALAETGRCRGLSVLSPLNRGSFNLPGHVSTREGTAGRLSTVSRMIPQIGNLTDSARRQFPQSAPVKVPDWSKIVGISQEMQDQDVSDDGERLPPHELLAREHARNQMITFSVHEGAGRTLKGRDLSRVRNTIWRQTGFLE
eukprot:c47086_g1_i1 orf=258-1022(+)